MQTVSNINLRLIVFKEIAFTLLGREQRLKAARVALRHLCRHLVQINSPHLQHGMRSVEGERKKTAGS
jgi:hypothetical protein